MLGAGFYVVILACAWDCTYEVNKGTETKCKNWILELLYHIYTLVPQFMNYFIFLKSFHTSKLVPMA